MGDNDLNIETVEQEAREVGWKPLEEFKGDPEKWVEAEEYLRRGETMLPILRGNLRDLRKELKTRDAKHQQELAELKSTLGEVREFYSKAEQRAYDNALKKVRAEMKQAVAEGDTERYNEAEAQLDELTATPNKVAEPAKAGGQPKPLPGWENPEQIIADWRKDNEWYWSDPFLGMEGQQLSGYLASTKTYATMRDMLDEVTDLMKKRHPEAFGQRRKGSDDVDSGGERGGAVKRKGKHTFADLPKEDQATFKRFEKTIPGYTWEEFESAYEWEK